MSTENDALAGIDMSGYAAQPEPVVASEPDTPPANDDEPDPNVNDELELTGDDELAPGEDGEPEPGKKPRHKSAKERIDEITKARREAERRAEAAEARLAAMERGDKPAAQPTADLRAQIVEQMGPAPNPEDAKYEFGDADPQYLIDAATYNARLEAKLEVAEERAAALATEQQQQIQAAADEANTNWQKLAESGATKYEDFNETVVESAAAKEWPLLPLSALAVASSDNGDEIAYHLATHRDEAQKLAALELQFHQTRDAALEAGLPANLVALFVQPHLDRATEYFEGIQAKVKGAAKPEPKPAKIATDAPEPAKHRVRGGGGQFAPDFTSENCDLESLAKALK